MAGDSEAINEATLDLLERRIADRVTETARKRVIAYYVAFGSGLSALAALAGFAAVQWVKDTADHKIEVIINGRTADIDRQAAKLVAQQRKAETVQAVIDELTRQSNRTLGDIATALRDFGLKTQQLQEVSEAVTKLEPRVDAIRALPEIFDRNSAEIQALGQQLAALAAQMAALATVAKEAPAGALGGVAAARYGDIAASTSQVAKQTIGIADGIQAARARPVVYLQFSGYTRDVADQLRTTLGGDNFTFPPAERIGSATGLFEVRYFYRDDKASAERLAAAATELARTLVPGETRTAEPKPLVEFRGTKPKPGTIELWYGPAR